jgi:hypothetical protein
VRLAFRPARVRPYDHRGAAAGTAGSADGQIRAKLVESSGSRYGAHSRYVEQLGAPRLATATANGGGRQKLQESATSASASWTSLVPPPPSEWIPQKCIDYMHLSRTHEGWRIVNVPEELRPSGE